MRHMRGRFSRGLSGTRGGNKAITTGGGGAVTAVSGSHPALPTAAVTHWWDFTDVNVLYQDDELTTLVTAAEQTVNGVVDKGSAEMDLGAASGGPLYEVGGDGSNSYAAFEDENSNTIQTSVSTYDWTVATDRKVLIVFDVEDFAGTNYLIDIAGTGSNLILNNQPGANILQSTWSGGSTNVPDIEGDVGAVAVIFDHTHDAAPLAYASHTETVGAHESATESAAFTNVDWVFGSVDEGNALFLTGRIYEVAAWLEGTAPTVAELQTYTESAYGITWT